MTTITTDAELVTAHLSGDRGALAGIYDRYADTLYDTAAAMLRDRHEAADVMQDVFVVAAERLGQLRDPDRLKPWLFAILRNEVYRRTGKRRRTVATDFTEAAAEMQLPPDQSDETDAIAHEELATLVRSAAAGLDERDQLVLEYSVRQGLEGDDLAHALGVSTQQSYSMLHRMRQRAERSLGAFCVAKAGRRDCAELDAILRDWDGTFSVLIRKRVARHIDSCDTCERSRKTLAPLALFGAAPALQPPAGLRDRVLAAADQGAPSTPYGFEAPGGFPSVLGTGRRLLLWLGLAGVALLAVVGGGVWVLAQDDEPDVLATADVQQAPPVPPGPVANAADGEAGDGDGAGDAPVAAPVESAPPFTTPATTDGPTESSAPTQTSAPTESSIAPDETTPESTTPEATQPPTTTIVEVGTPPTTTIVQVGPPPTVPPPPDSTAPPTAPPTTTTLPPTTTTTVAPGSLSLSASNIDFGTDLNASRVTLSNDGGQSVDWSTSFGPSGFRAVSTAYAVSPASGTLAPGESVDVTVTIDRRWPTEGATTSGLTFSAKGTDASVQLAGVIARPPVIDPSATPGEICAFAPTGARNFLTAGATVTDESLPLTVLYEATSSTDGVTVSQAMRADRTGAWVSSIDISNLADATTWTWTITATDALGNTGTASGRTTVVPTFC